LYLISEKSSQKEPGNNVRRRRITRTPWPETLQFQTSAELIKSHNPLSEGAVRGMKIGEITPVSYKLGII